MTERSDGSLRSWDASDLEDNLPNVRYDGDSLEVTCPECELFGSITLSLAIEYGTVTCENCETEFGLLLVEQRSTDSATDRPD